MDKATLRKVQLTQLEILKEIRRVCEENDISYFLCCGTFLGAVRHQGFIPWDDDLDIGMVRPEYEKFCRIAPAKLGPEFCLQNWYTDPVYSLPFGKVRKRNTLYLEAKSIQLEENGIYVDVFPFDNVPSDPEQRRAYASALQNLFRMKLMKSHYRPWISEDRIIWKKRIGYLYYQVKAMFYSGSSLIRKYDAIAAGVPEGTMLCRQRGLKRLDCYQKSWCQELADYPFEQEIFTGPGEYDAFLTAQFGDYLQLPPEDQRENRHQIIKVDFGEADRDIP